MTYDIKRTNGSVEWLVKTVHPAGTQGAKAMGENVVDMSFTLPIYVDFKINDFVVVYGETYKINITPSVKKVAKRKYEYQIQFEHLFYDLAKVQLQFLNPQNQLLEPVFNLMGNAATIVGLIVENANRHSPGWTVGVVDDTAYQNYSFNAENCLQTLNRLASDNETEFWIENKTIHLQKREQSSGLQFEYGQGKGLYSIYRSNKSNINILTRLYVRGGSRNLPADYRNYATSLLLPNGATYIQDDAKVNPQTGYGLIESTIVFENIFPQREGTISAVVAGNDNWDKFTDNSLDFDVNAYKLATPAKVAFNTGQLAGYKFEISDYNHATKQFTIIQNTDEALTVPSNLIRPAVGDKYVLLDIKMPQTYVDAAEAKLLAAAQAYYAKNSDPSLNFAYSVDCDPIWFKQQNVTVVLGNTVVIYDADLGINGAIRIAGYKRDLQIASKYELEISDSIGASEIVRQYAQQQRTLQLIESSGLLDINQIRKNIFLNRLSESGGYLMLSGAKIKAGFADYALNANHADLADYALDADKWDGRQFDDYINQPLRKTDNVKFASVVADTVNSTVYVSGFTGSGYRINPDGSAEFDSLTVRKELNINVLNVREITGSGGSVAITNVAKIKEVIDYDTFFRCKINTDDGTIAVQLRTNDVIRCQIWDGKKLKYYSAIVTSVGADFFDFDKSSIIGGGLPQPGDTVFQFGNTTNVNRQGLIYLTNSDTGAPYLDVLDGITSDNLAGKTKVRLGKLNGINDADLGQLEGYGLYAERAFIKGKIVVTGGNAATINNVADAKLEAITSATSQASADANAKASAAQVNAIQTAANDASTKINALQIGGRNFFINSHFYAGLVNWYSNYGNESFTIVNGKLRVTAINDGAIGAYQNVAMPVGDYVFQVKIFTSSSFAVRLYEGENQTSYAKIVNGLDRFEYKFHKYTTNPVNYFILCSDGIPAGEYIELEWVKIEQGNKATDWTPAPEDSNAYADQKATEAQTAAQTYAATQSAYEREIAKAYADGIVDAEEARAIADAVTKLNEAKADATTKVNAAQAAANGYTDDKSQAVLASAQTYADNSAQSKANTAQANAVSIASNDAQAKADAARLQAEALAAQLVGSIKVGGRNLFPNSKAITVTANDTGLGYVVYIPNGNNPYFKITADADKTVSVYTGLPQVFEAGQTYTLSVWVTTDVAGYAQIYAGGNMNSIDFTNTYVDGNKWWQINCVFNPSTAFVPHLIMMCNQRVLYYRDFKLEKGNKATDWTPATEDVQNAIDTAQNSANIANAAYASLTASLKSLAFVDVVELSKLGSTIIENGMIKTVLLDANYIRANIVNAAYINALNIDASAIKSGTIDSARINASQIIVNGGGATQSYADTVASTAQANAINSASADATSKANAAQTTANNYTDGKSQATLTAAQTYADNSAQSKANAAQANAIATASADATNKASAAQSAAATLSQQLVDSIKIGGRNLFPNSKTVQTYPNDTGLGNSVNLGSYYMITADAGKTVSQYAGLPQVFEAGQTYTLSVWVTMDVPGYAYIYAGGSMNSSVFENTYVDGQKWYQIQCVFNPASLPVPHFILIGNQRVLYYRDFKIEKGNKATDWTPATQDVQTAIDTAQNAANIANAAYASLTASLKSLAYADVVELSKLGSTVIENGMIKTTLLDANYIRANIVNASYITALDIVATKVAATQGFIGGFNIVNQSLIAGSGSDNPTAWDLNSSNIRLYTDFQLYRKIGGTADQTDEMAVHLGYYPATSGLSYKDTLVLKNNIRNTAQDYMPPSSLNGSGAIYRQKNRALILEAKNSDENIALEVMSGHVYLRGVNDAGTANAFRNGYIKYVNMNGRQVLVLDSNPTELNTGIPDA